MVAVQLFSGAGAGVVGSSTQWVGGLGTFSAVGTFNGGIVKLQFLGPDQSTWIDAGSSTMIVANGGANFELPAGQIRGVIVGSSAGVHARASRIR